MKTEQRACNLEIEGFSSMSLRGLGAEAKAACAASRAKAVLDNGPSWLLLKSWVSRCQGVKVSES
jgi:hypothetical protein